MTIKDNARGRMLLDAHRCVNEDRNANYGDPNQDFKRTAGYWNIHLGGIFDRKLMEEGLDARSIPPEFRAVLDNVFETWDVAIMQGFVKKSRLAWSPGKLDSWVDGAGYDACGVDCIVAAGLANVNDLPVTDEHVVVDPPSVESGLLFTAQEMTDATTSLARQRFDAGV